MSEFVFDLEGVKMVSVVLGLLFVLSMILFIVCIVMMWYSSVSYTKLSWVLAYASTEFLFKFMCVFVLLVGGVDVLLIIWVGMISFMNEILLGK